MGYQGSQKNILALSCSPSKDRNSDTMLNSFIDGIQEIEGINVEKIYLYSIPFDYHTYENRNGPEPNEIEFRNLTDKIQNCDGLVIATPTYNFSVPAKLKNLIDRIRFFALDFDNKTLLGQPVGMLGKSTTFFLVSGGTPNWAQKILFFIFPSFWLKTIFFYYGSKCMGSIYSGNTKTFENKRILKKCRKAGQEYARKTLKKT